MSKEHAYAYEAGYRDGSINYELEHCPACKNVADLQEALDENARLRDLMYSRAHDHAIQHMTEDELRITAANALDENAKLRDSLKALMMGTNVELCADRDASQCQECSMALDEHRCAMSDAILLLGIDMYGEPL